MLGHFSGFCCRYMQDFKIFFFKKKSSINPIRVSNVLDPDQDRHLVGPVLGPNTLQSLSTLDSADSKSHLYARKELRNLTGLISGSF